MADRVGAGPDLAEARVAVSDRVHDTGVSVGVGERMEDTVSAGVGVNAGKDIGERFSREEGDDHRIGVRGGNVDRRRGVLSKCLRDISHPVIRRLRLGVA